MGVLIVDQDRASVEQAVQAIRWGDRRWRIDVARDGSEAWEKGLKQRPSILLCGMVLPDISGAQLCANIRPRLPQSKFLAYATDNAAVQQLLQDHVFDALVAKPLERLALLKHLHRGSSDGTQIGARARPTASPAEQSFARITIFVRQHNEPELRFGVPVPECSTIETVLRQLGKSSVAWFALQRGNQLLHDAVLTSPVQANDLLILGAEQPGGRTAT